MGIEKRRHPGRWWTCVAALLTACGGGGGSSEALSPGNVPATANGPDYAPLAVGDTWLYRRDDGGLERTKVTGTGTVSGQPTIIVTDSDITAGTTQTTTYRKSAGSLTELPDASDPLLTVLGPMDSLHLPLRVGDTFTQVDRTLADGFDADGDSRADVITLRSTVTVLSTESVTVPAGTFEGCLKVRTQLTQSAVGSSNGQRLVVITVLDEWYAPNIGVVRARSEVTSGGTTEVQLHELQSFRVGTRSNDTVAPQILATSPERGATAGTSVVVRIDFDESLDATAVSGNAVTLLDASGRKVGTAPTSVSGSRLESNLPVPLPSGTYTLVLDDSVQDLLGNRIPAQQWSLTIDGAAPALVSSQPAANDARVPVSTAIDLHFSEAVTAESVKQGVQIRAIERGDGVPFTATVLDTQTLRLQPQVALRGSTDYQITVSGIADLRGNVSNTATTIAFRTAPSMFQSSSTVLNGFVTGGPVAVGDVSGDGRADVVSVAAGTRSLLVQRQGTDGTIEPGYSVPLHPAASLTCEPDSIQVADLNGDGRLDVVVAERDCGLEVLLQNASGVLEPGPFLSSGNSRVVRAADLNGDGRADLLAIGGGQTVSIWLQRSDTTWGAPTLIALAHAGTIDMAVGDINGDGRPDIAVSSMAGGQPERGIALLLQRADGAFEPGGQLSVDDDWGAQGVAIGDINGDGRADIVAGFLGDGLAVFMQGGDGQLQSMNILPGFNQARYFRIVDLDGDGRQDLLVRQIGLPSLIVMRQRADGTLARVQQLEELYAVDGPDRLDVGDVNGDGLLDVVMSGPRIVLASPLTAAAMNAKMRARSAVRAVTTAPRR